MIVSLDLVMVVALLLTYADAVGIYLRRSLSLAHTNNMGDQRSGFCSPNCTKCHRFMGCLQCNETMHLHTYKVYNFKVGLCIQKCPRGYYSVAKHNYRYCKKCSQNQCQHCYNEHYCARCESHLWRHKGKCLHTCPDGLYPNRRTKRCQKNVDCKVTQWSSWTPCVTKQTKCENRTCTSDSKPCELSCMTCIKKMRWKYKTRMIEQYTIGRGKHCPRKMVKKRRCRKKDIKDIQLTCTKEEIPDLSLRGTG